MKSIRLCIAVFLFGWSTVASAQSLELTISTANTTIPSGQPVIIAVQLMNNTDHELMLRRHLGEILPGSVYTLKVTRADARPVQETPFAISLRNGVNGSRSLRVLPAGESLVESLNIARFVDMTVPGIYQVVLKREHSEADQKPLSSNTISIRITN